MQVGLACLPTRLRDFEHCFLMTDKKISLGRKIHRIVFESYLRVEELSQQVILFYE